MCRFKTFCGCCGLRAAAVVAFVLSSFYCGFISIVTLITALNITSKEGWGAFFYVLLLLVTTVLCLVFIGGTISLLFAIIKEREQLVVIWLVTAVAFAVWVIIWLASHVYTEEHGTDAFVVIVLIIVLWIDLILIYIWIAVLNYYYELKEGQRTYSFAAT